MVVRVNSRWQAFGIHLGISLAVFLCIAFVVGVYWYPYESMAFGGIRGLKILFGVDIVLGPLLTLIVYNKAKSSLKWDLSVIGLLQISALGYGLYTVNAGRVIGQILDHEGVHIVSLSELKQYEIEVKNFAKGEKLPIKRFLYLPPNIGQIHQVAIATEVVEGRPIYLRTDLYKMYSENKKTQEEVMTLLSYSASSANKSPLCNIVTIHSKQKQFSGCLNISKGDLFRITHNGEKKTLSTN